MAERYRRQHNKEHHDMSTQTYPPPAPFLGEEPQVLRNNWGWLLALGIALIILGCMAIATPYIFTEAAVLVLAILLLISAGTEIASAIWARRWRGFFLHLLAGVLYFIVGVLMIGHPGVAAAGLTLMLAVSFLVGGLFRIIFALSERFSGWGWALFNGFVTALLGVLIWQQWPESSFYVIGLFLGIEMLFNGWSWVMLALLFRSLPRTTT
jgi:uncharacterized membrane protein HdeD (DUF308 family)